MLKNITPPLSFLPSDSIFMLITLLNTLTAVDAGLQPDYFSQSKGTVTAQENKEWLNMTEKVEVDPFIPSSIKPVNYKLYINPNLETGTFEGNAEILINVLSTATYVPLHAKDLEIIATEVTDEKETSLAIQTSYSEKNQFWVMKGNFTPGYYTATLEFKGRLTEKIVGFYLSQYTDASGKKRNIATTKFEPVDARQAFPCFDEPALKAKFSIRIERPRENYSALSNMNILREEVGPTPDKVIVTFEETVPMSTYLVCFVISDFVDSGEVVVDNMGSILPIKVYSTPEQVPNTIFAKRLAVYLTKYYIEYFGIPYRLPKLDLIAIPDFATGAMENWGLITFRETSLLHNEKTNSVTGKQRIATVISHEISHQWFGNLVTMKWWDDLWLNEGFASFMQYKGVDQAIPDCRDWQIMDYAIYEQIFPVLKRDALLSSHPIIQSVTNPNQISEIFDSISYHKGFAVIRMLESFIGEDNFKSGIQNYLRAHQFSTATTADLWSFLNKEINSTSVSVGDVMDTWTRQTGYPVITIEKTNSAWVLRQSRFLIDYGAVYDPAESHYKYKWDIPIYFITDTFELGFIWFKRGQKSVKIPRETGSGFIKLNHKQVGFYRVNYPAEVWKALENILRSTSQIFNAKDRSNLVDDAFSLAEAGIIEYGIALDLIAFLRKDKDFLPWAVGSSVLSDICNRVYFTPIYSGFKKFVHFLIKEKYGKRKSLFCFNVGANDTHLQKLFRVKILGLACETGLPACLQEAGEKFLEWIKKPATFVHPDVRSLVFQYGMKAVGRETEWNIVWARYLKEVNPQEKLNLLLSLSFIKEPWILSKFIQMAKNETYIRSQDYFQVLSFISMNPIGNPLVWAFYRNEWPYLVKRFSLNDRPLGAFIAVVTGRFANQVEVDEIESFFKKYPDAGAGATARKLALERARINKKWLERNESVISKWLIKNKFL